MTWIVVALALLGLGGLALAIRMLTLPRRTRVALVVMGVGLLIAAACVLLVHSMVAAAVG
jgi:hypothetical protein